MKNFSKLIALIAMITAIGSATVMAAETGEKVSADDQHMDWHKMSPEKCVGTWPSVKRLCTMRSS